jgi:biopolymer transport protein ExbB/TolQ
VKDTLPASLADTLASVVPSSEEAPAAPAIQADDGPDRFALRTLLGQGGVGRVHEALDKQFGRLVAVKELSAEAPSADSVRRFLVEAVVTGNLEHPGIPAVYGRGAREGRPFYAMRRIEGRTLADALREARTLSGRLKLLRVVGQTAHTLGFAHERGVVHRDVKPENIVVGRHGEVALLDWGIAKVRGAHFTDATRAPLPGAGDTQSTLHGSVLGTPAYMAPEQARGEVAAIDERTDVFALGALIYHVLAGRAPYEGTSVNAVLASALDSDRPSLERLAPHAPASLRQIADRAMSADPAARYANATEVAEALEGFMNEAVAVRPPRLLEIFVNLMIAGGLLCGVVAVAAMFAFGQSWKEQGFPAYFVATFGLLGIVIAILEWRTRGRHRLGPLVLAGLVCTPLVGLWGTVTGLLAVARGLEKIAQEGALFRQLAMRGFWEATGPFMFALALTILQLILWAVGRRAGLTEAPRRSE